MFVPKIQRELETVRVERARRVLREPDNQPKPAIGSTRTARTSDRRPVKPRGSSGRSLPSDITHDG